MKIQTGISDFIKEASFLFIYYNSVRKTTPVSNLILLLYHIQPNCKQTLNILMAVHIT